MDCIILILIFQGIEQHSWYSFEDVYVRLQSTKVLFIFTFIKIYTYTILYTV